MKNVAVILAAGKGSRIGSQEPKQFLKINGKTILEYSLSTFEEHEQIDEISIVVSEDYIHEVEALVEAGAYSKVKNILVGGQERFQSSLAAVNAYASSDCNILLHDAARPLLSAEIISSCIEGLKTYEAVCTAVPTTDTILALSANGEIETIPPRAMLYNAQTPQAFRIKTISRAFALAMEDSEFKPTDDCSVVRRELPEVPIKVVRGDERNFKITFLSDLEHIKFLLTNN